MAAGHDEHPVAEPLELLGVGGGDDDGDALVGDLAQDPVDLRPRPDVHALGRLVGEQDRGTGEEGPGEHDLLLVATRQGRDDRLHGGGADVQLRQLTTDQLELARPAEERAPGHPLQTVEGGVLAHRQGHHQAVVMTVRGHVARDLAQLALAAPPPRDGDVAVEGAEARERSQQVALAVPDDPADADDLAAPTGERDVGEAVTRQCRHVEHRVAERVGRGLRREGRVQLASDDHGQQLVVGDVVHQRAAPQPTVAQDGDALGEHRAPRRAGG